MLETDAQGEFPRGDNYEPPPPRDRMPTIPEDLSEYAWIHTGPPSVPDDDVGSFIASSDAESWLSSPLDDITAGPLVDIWHSDVPYVDTSGTAVIDEQEAQILSLIDGHSSLGTLLEMSSVPSAMILTALCDLCARGIVKLDRSRRSR